MKILLATPPSNALTVTPPIGLGYLVSVLRENGYDAGILDAQKESLDTERVLEKISKINPDVLGVSILTSNYANAKKIVKEAKKLIPRTKIVVGGPHPSALPVATLKEVPADFLIRGEGEYSFLDLVNFLAGGKGDPSHIENLCFSENGEIKTKPCTIQVKDLDKIPPPAWDLIEPRQYPVNPHQFFFKKHPIAPVVTTRGCPFRCTFCSASFLAGENLRMRSPEKVVDEIELLATRHGVKEIHFEDDNFTLVRKHAESICKKIIERKIKIVWQCPNGIRVDTIDRDLVRLMKKSGCYRLSFGIESGSQEILDRANKKLDLKKVPGAIKTVKDEGIEVQAFFILGLPGETKETALKTMNLIKELPIDFLDISLLTYLPGSRLFNERFKSNEYDSIKWDEFNYFTAQPTETLSAKELKGLQKTLLRKFYLNPRTVFYMLRSLKPRQIPLVFKIALKYFV
ncbi:MAG: radical SAM protein [Candidatus Omnitrophota bacterium]